MMVCPGDACRRIAASRFSKHGAPEDTPGVQPSVPAGSLGPKQQGTLTAPVVLEPAVLEPAVVEPQEVVAELQGTIVSEPQEAVAEPQGAVALGR